MQSIGKRQHRWIEKVAWVTVFQFMAIVFAMPVDFATQQHHFVPELQGYIHVPTLGWDPDDLRTCIQPSEKVANHTEPATICMFFHFLMQQVTQASKSCPVFSTRLATLWQLTAWESHHPSPIAILELAPKLSPPT